MLNFNFQAGIILLILFVRLIHLNLALPNMIINSHSKNSNKSNFPTSNTSNHTINNFSLVSQRKYAHLYTNLKTYFLRWYLPVVICLGIVGTVFCLIFLFLSRLFPSNMLIWLVSICIGDFLILCMEGIWMLLKVWYDYDLRDISDWICVIHSGLSNYLFYWSAYMQSFLSLQRAYLIIRPLRAKSNGPTMICLIRIWIIVSLLLVIPMLPYAIYWRVIDGDCDPKHNDLFYVTTLCDFVVWGLIPLIGMTTSTVIICWNIFRLRKSFQMDLHQQQQQHYNEQQHHEQAKSKETNELIFQFNKSPNKQNEEFNENSFSVSVSDSILVLSNKMRKLSHNLSDKNLNVHLKSPFYDYKETNLNKINKSNLISVTPSTPTTHRTCLIKSRNISTNHIEIQNKASSMNRINCVHRHGATDNAGHVTRLLICMNIWYMASTYPLMIYLMLLNFFLNYVDRDVHKFMYYLSRSLCFLNACSNWIFYCASGRLFRQRTWYLFRKFLHRLNIYSSSQSSVPYDYTIQLKNKFIFTNNNQYNQFCKIKNFNINNNNNLNQLKKCRLHIIKQFNNHPIPIYESKPNSFNVNSKVNKQIQLFNTNDFNHSKNVIEVTKKNIRTTQLTDSFYTFKCRCFCNLFNCICNNNRNYNNPDDHVNELEPNKITQTNHQVYKYQNNNNNANDNNNNNNNITGLLNKHDDINIDQYSFIGCNGCFSGFCCWKFWWYGLITGRIKDSNSHKNNSSIQPYLSSSSSSNNIQSLEQQQQQQYKQSDEQEKLHRTQSDYIYQCISKRYCMHYKSIDRVRDLDLYVKSDYNLSIQKQMSSPLIKNNEVDNCITNDSNYGKKYNYHICHDLNYKQSNPIENLTDNSLNCYCKYMTTNQLPSGNSTQIKHFINHTNIQHDYMSVHDLATIFTIPTTTTTTTSTTTINPVPTTPIFNGNNINNNSNNNNNSITNYKCYCYISSHGNRKYHYNFCKYHQKFVQNYSPTMCSYNCHHVNKQNEINFYYSCGFENTKII